MRIEQSSQQGCVVLALAGRLDLAAAPQLRRAVLRQLARQPTAVICDLGQVEEMDPRCAGVLASVSLSASSWPGTSLLLCGARRAVADTLRRQGVAARLAIYPSLEAALANARARPPRRQEHLSLRPVPTAAREGRAFLREVCGRWGIQAMADPAALVASELVALTVGQAGTPVELRVELVGSRLGVAVSDQDPDLLGLLAAGEETDRSLSLLVVDQVASAWGVRQDEAGGKTAWCTLELPPPQSDPVDPADGVGASPLSLVRTKLSPPTSRAGLIPRASLQSLLERALEAKLCLLAAPAGSGKTTLLTQWQAAAGADRVAWVSLEEEDNDPTRFWSFVVEALRTVEPDVGTAALRALQGASTDLDRVVLPSLLNDLTDVGSPLVLVLDDYHVIANPTCHQSLGFFLEHLPVGVHVALATRIDPPLPLARMRARGELAEIRVADLQFTDEEASALLNGSMGLRLGAKDVARLAERTEGWAAGLVLAGLSLRGREDPSGFVASFHGDHRHVTDYLGAEVLARQSEDIRAFLLRTSVLERLSGPLCDAVLEIQGSAELLAELERSNLFLMSLDDRREWYRYHRLFAHLLRLQLAEHDPGLVPVLHRRAAAWYRAAGHADQAIHHATAAGEHAQAAELIAQHWLRHWRQGHAATVARWLDGLPEEAILADPRVAYVAAWVRGCSGASKQQTEGWLAAAEDDAYQGPLPDGVSLAFACALTRASLPFDDVGESVRAARRAMELADPAPAPSWWMALAALGQARYLAGEPAELRPQLEELVERVSPAGQPYAVVIALAVLSLIAGDRADDHAAMVLARRAAATAKAQGLSAAPLCTLAYLALGRALTRLGELSEAEQRLDRVLELTGIDSMALHRAGAVLLLATVRRGRGDLPGARALLRQARELIEQFTDPGVLAAILERTERAVGTAPLRPGTVSAPLTARELAVLRLLPTRLSTREIGRELSVSVNTVRTQVQAVYRKLEVSTRSEAVSRARQLDLLPRSSTDPVA